MHYKNNLHLRYKVIKQIGQGGRGVVNLCKDYDTDKTYACKTIEKSSRFINDEQAIIDNEINVHRIMNISSKVAKLVDVYEDNHSVHILTEHLSGGNLESYCGHPETVIQGYIKQVLEALAECHDNHVIHRDVKPANFVQVSEDSSEIKIIDFGLSQRFAELPMENLRIEGTTWYMAPEIFRGESEPASDMWSTGVMAYWFMASKFPFSGKRNDLYSIVRDILNNEPHFDPLIFSDSSQDFIRMMLEKKPRSRPTARAALIHPWFDSK